MTRRLLLLAVLLAACGGDSTGPPAPVATVAVSPVADTVIVTTTTQLMATLRDAGNRVLTGRTVTWSSGDTAIATVSAAGLVMGVAAGAATITATAEGHSGQAAITVIPVPVASVTVTPDSSVAYPGQTRPLTATPRDSAGNPLGGRAVAWSSLQPTIASVDAAGLVTANTNDLYGLARIAATVEGRVDTAKIVVVPVPVASVTVAPTTDTIAAFDTLRFTATPRDSAGNPLANRIVGWSSSDTIVATAGADGLVSGHGGNGGTVTITATSEGQSGTAQLTVQPAPVSVVAVTPAVDSLLTGDSLQLTATAYDSAGHPLSGRPFTWYTDTTIVTVSAAGRIRGVRLGVTFVTAVSDEGPAGYAQITVQARVDSVFVAPPADTLFVGQLTDLNAFTYDSAGSAIFGRVVSWSSSDTLVARLNVSSTVSGGAPVTVSAVAPGSAIITATSESGSATATILVTLVPVAYVIATPDTATRLIGDTLRLTAIAYDSVGGVLPGRPVTWTTSNPLRATVDGTGLVTALGSDRARIIATIDGQADTATLFIPLPLALVSAAAQYTCGQTTGGVAYCWGLNNSGNLGNGSTAADSFPFAVSGGLLFRPVSAGTFHACGLASGAAYCWGNNGYGQLGTNSTASAPAPAAVSGGLSFRVIASGGQHTCALTGPGAAYCWGRNQAGQLGRGTTTLDSVPGLVSGALVFASVSAGGQYTCGVTTGNAAYCWGRGAEGQLGTNSTAGQTTPTLVSGGLSFKSVVAAGSHTCGLTPTGVAYCWGDNTYGALGTELPASDSVPVAVAGGLTFTALSAGTFHTCGVTTGGAAYCWGAAGGGRLGNGATTGQENAPVPVLGGLAFATISAGSFHTCATSTAGVAYCWGTGGSGELGWGSPLDAARPVPVVARPN